jgi:hypothetical protein
MLAMSAKTWDRTNPSNTYRNTTLKMNFGGASSSSDRANCFMEHISTNSSQGHIQRGKDNGHDADGLANRQKHSMIFDVHGLIDNLTKRQEYEPGVGHCKITPSNIVE